MVVEESAGSKYAIDFFTLAPYVISLLLIWRGTKVQDESKAVIYSLSFAIYLISAIATQSIAFQAQRKIVNDKGASATTEERGNYQFVSLTLAATVLLFMTVSGFIYHDRQHLNFAVPKTL